MSENKASQVQEIQGAWQKMVGEQVARVEQALGESARYRGQGMEQAKTAVDDWARLSKDTFDYLGQLQTEWSKLTIEATKRAAEMLIPRV